MRIKTPTRPPRRYIDYELLKRRYNSAKVGQVIEFEAVYNVTTFSRRLEDRGLKRKSDFQVENRKDRCLVTKLSQAEMS